MNTDQKHSQLQSNCQESQAINGPVSPDPVLTAEFEYIAQTAFQANEDRSRISTFYLVTVGSLVAAIVSTQAENLQDRYVYWAFAVLFGVLTLESILTLLQLARLRQAWLDSASAMNQIKEFYIEHLQHIDLTEAFRWRMNTLPAMCKPWSISWLLAFQVAVLGGVTFGAAIFFASLACGHWWWGWAIVAGMVVTVGQIEVYRRLLQP